VWLFLLSVLLLLNDLATLLFFPAAQHARQLFGQVPPLHLHTAIFIVTNKRSIHYSLSLSLSLSPLLVLLPSHEKHRPQHNQTFERSTHGRRGIYIFCTSSSFARVLTHNVREVRGRRRDADEEVSSLFSFSSTSSHNTRTRQYLFLCCMVLLVCCVTLVCVCVVCCVLCVLCMLCVYVCVVLCVLCCVVRLYEFV